MGHPEEHDSECELAVVEVKSSLDVCCVRLDHGMEFMPHEKGERIASVACDLSGNLVVTTGLLSYGRDKDWLVLSDANKCSEKWSGAVFFDLDGNFWYEPLDSFATENSSRTINIHAEEGVSLRWHERLV